MGGRTSRARARRAAVAAGLALLAAAPAANAATVAVVPAAEGPQLVFTALPGEVNDVTLGARDGLFVVADSGAPLVPGPGCAPAEANVALCSSFVVGLELRLADGDDRLTMTAAGVALENLPSVVYAGDGDDSVTGGASRDFVDAGAGADTVAGGGNGDTISYALRTAPVTVDLDGEAGDDGEAGEGDTIAADVENVHGGAGDDALTGNAETNFLRGNGGADQLSGGPGGGPGDWADYENATAGVVVDLEGDADDGAPGEGDRVGSDVEHVVGGAGDDVLTGSVVANQLRGMLGDDVVTGGGGNDRLEGGRGADSVSGAAGNDVVDGGSGTDAMDGGTGSDTASYALRAEPLAIDLDGVDDDGAAGENDALAGLEHVTGGDAGDAITGDGGRNVLAGGGGSDDLDGGAGDDDLDGGSGDDELAGAAGIDRLIGGEGADALAGGDANDVLEGGAGDDSAEGGAGNDTVAGGDGDDDLLGAAGSDRLSAGLGADVLGCGSDSDDAVANPAVDTVDRDCERVTPEP